MTGHERQEWIDEIKKLINHEREEQTKALERDMKRIIDNGKSGSAGGR